MNPADRALARAEMQQTLFGSPNRAALHALTWGWSVEPLRVRVHRNHGFEPVASALAPFAAWNGLGVDFDIGSYDDSLAAEPRGDADVELLWLDVDHYSAVPPSEQGAWLAGRVAAFRGRTAAPILVLAWPLAAEVRAAIDAAAIPACHVADIDALADELAGRWLDPRTEKLMGTRLSGAACVRVARELACRWLPACVLPPRKVVAVDLDGTLYAGVLGEDGPDGVRLTDGHVQLQRTLRELAGRGVLLALVSRNELADVEAMFARRTDFPLRLSDFAAVEVSWGDKADAIARSAQALRIGTDAVVFVDDNPGELAAVASRLPVFTVHARADGGETATALGHVAGLWRWRGAAEDGLRANDLRAARERDALAGAATTPADYLRSLNVRLEYTVRPQAHLARLADLVQKTNQFNLSLGRANEAEIARRLADPAGSVVAIGLADRLSDSGIVGVLVGERDRDTLRVDEVCVSCRALGRHLEDSMLTQALMLMAGGDAPRQVAFAVRAGPRNQPARQWLEHYAGAPIAPDASEVTLPFDAIRAKPIEDAVRIEIVR